MSAHRTHTGHFAVVRPWPGFGSGRAGQPSCYSILPERAQSSLPLTRLRRRRFFFAKGIKSLHYPHYPRWRPFPAASGWNARIIQARRNGPQTRFPGRL